MACISPSNKKFDIVKIESPRTFLLNFSLNNEKSAYRKSEDIAHLNIWTTKLKFWDLIPKSLGKCSNTGKFSGKVKS